MTTAPDGIFCIMSDLAFLTVPAPAFFLAQRKPDVSYPSVIISSGERKNVQGQGKTCPLRFIKNSNLEIKKAYAMQFVDQKN